MVVSDCENKEEDELCVVCSNETTLFAIGKCDHAICFECSIKMRVITLNKDCAICRTSLDKVYIMKENKPFQSVDTKFFFVEITPQIYFQDKHIRDQYYQLLSHECKICLGSFPEHSKLKCHMQNIHELYCCHLCEDNKIFPSERKYYTLSDLERHMNCGDEGDYSHKGHPKCRFCESHFVDMDALARHLLRDHFQCHFCESNGRTNEIFRDFADLNRHFDEDHFLCTIDMCADMQFTNAFATENELARHIDTVHRRDDNIPRSQRPIQFPLGTSMRAIEAQRQIDRITMEYFPSSNTENIMAMIDEDERRYGPRLMEIQLIDGVRTIVRRPLSYYNELPEIRTDIPFYRPGQVYSDSESEDEVTPSTSSRGRARMYRGGSRGSTDGDRGERRGRGRGRGRVASRGLRNEDRLPMARRGRGRAPARTRGRYRDENGERRPGGRGSFRGRGHSRARGDVDGRMADADENTERDASRRHEESNSSRGPGQRYFRENRSSYPRPSSNVSPIYDVAAHLEYTSSSSDTISDIVESPEELDQVNIGCPLVCNPSRPSDAALFARVERQANRRERHERRRRERERFNGESTSEQASAPDPSPAPAPRRAPTSAPSRARAPALSRAPVPTRDPVPEIQLPPPNHDNDAEFPNLPGSSGTVHQPKFAPRPRPSTNISNIEDFPSLGNGSSSSAVPEAFKSTVSTSAPGPSTSTSAAAFTSAKKSSSSAKTNGATQANVRNVVGGVKITRSSDLSGDSAKVNKPSSSTSSSTSNPTPSAPPPSSSRQEFPSLGSSSQAKNEEYPALGNSFSGTLSRTVSAQQDVNHSNPSNGVKKSKDKLQVNEEEYPSLAGSSSKAKAQTKVQNSSKNEKKSDQRKDYSHKHNPLTFSATSTAASTSTTASTSTAASTSTTASTSTAASTSAAASTSTTASTSAAASTSTDNAGQGFDDSDPDKMSNKSKKKSFKPDQIADDSINDEIQDAIKEYRKNKSVNEIQVTPVVVSQPKTKSKPKEKTVEPKVYQKKIPELSKKEFPSLSSSNAPRLSHSADARAPVNINMPGRFIKKNNAQDKENEFGSGKKPSKKPKEKNVVSENSEVCDSDDKNVDEPKKDPKSAKKNSRMDAPNDCSSEVNNDIQDAIADYKRNKCVDDTSTSTFKAESKPKSPKVVETKIKIKTLPEQSKPKPAAVAVVDDREPVNLNLPGRFIKKNDNLQDQMDSIGNGKKSSKKVKEKERSVDDSSEINNDIQDAIADYKRNKCVDDTSTSTFKAESKPKSPKVVEPKIKIKTEQSKKEFPPLSSDTMRAKAPVIDDRQPVNLDLPGRFINKNSEQQQSSSMSKKPKANQQKKHQKPFKSSVDFTFASSDSSSPEQPSPSQSTSAIVSSSLSAGIESPPGGFTNPFLKHSDHLIRSLSTFEVMNAEMDIGDIEKFKSLLNLYIMDGIVVGNFVAAIGAMHFQFDRFFEQLLVTLPDIRKQNELSSLFKYEPSGDLHKCKRCFQIMFMENIEEHQDLHKSSDFPSLQSGAGTSRRGVGNAPK